MADGDVTLKMEGSDRRVSAMRAREFTLSCVGQSVHSQSICKRQRNMFSKGFVILKGSASNE